MSSGWPTRENVEATRAVVDEQTAPLPETTAPPPPGAPVEEPPPDRDLWPWLVVLLVLVIAALVGAWLATRHRHHRAAAASTGTPVQTIAPAPRQKPPAGRVAVPSLAGRTAPAALAALHHLGLAGTTRGVFSARPRNEVVGQKPAAAARIARGSTVALTVSKGRKPAPVPDVGGQQVAAAIATLKAQELRANVVRVPSDQPAGEVLAQHPKGGATAATGSAVRLNIAAGAPGTTSTTTTSATTTTAASSTPPSAITVPDVRGEKLSAARKAFRQVGLVTEIRHVPNALAKNTVVAQSPAPGTSAKRGDHVLVTVSLGGHRAQPAAQSAVPDVTGEDEATATQDLQAAGFDVRVVDQDTTDQTQDGLVIDQDPAVGQQAPANSTVTIYVGRFGG